LATIAQGGHLQLWNVVNCQRQLLLASAMDSYWVVAPRPAYHPQGTLVAAVSGEDRIGLWNPATGTLVEELRGLACRCDDVVLRPDGTQLAAGGRNGVIYLWDLAAHVPVAELRGHRDMVYRLAYNRDGHLLASSSLDRTVRLWDAATYQSLAALPCGSRSYGL